MQQAPGPSPAVAGSNISSSSSSSSSSMYNLDPASRPTSSVFNLQYSNKFADNNADYPDEATFSKYTNMGLDEYRVWKAAFKATPLPEYFFQGSSEGTIEVHGGTALGHFIRQCMGYC